MYTPQEWYELVRNACCTNESLRSVEMASENFVSIKELKKLIVNRKEDTAGGTVNWMSIRWMEVQKEVPLQFRFRRSLNELEAWKEVDPRCRSKGYPADLGWFSFNKA